MIDGTAAEFRKEADRRKDVLIGLPVPTRQEEFGEDLSEMPGARLTSEDLHNADTVLRRAQIAHARAVYRDAVMGNRRRIVLLVHGASQNFGHLNQCFDLSTQ